MKIHEYQAKEILRRYGVATPRGRVTDNAADARTMPAAGERVLPILAHATLQRPASSVEPPRRTRQLPGTRAGSW